MEEIRKTLGQLRGEAREVDRELEALAADRRRYGLLGEACTVLEGLEQLDAGELFWGDLPEFKDPAGHIARLRSRVTTFEVKIIGILDRQARLKAQTEGCYDELDYLDDEVHDAYARDERREEEFAIERELSEVPCHPLLMPWSDNGEHDRRYRRTLRAALLLSLILIVLSRIIVVPVPPRPKVAVIPERLAMMVRQEPKKPAPVKKAEEQKKDKEKKHEEKPAEAKEAKNEVKKQAVAARETPAPERPRADQVEQTVAPKKSQSAGVLAFKESFKDLLDETSVAKLGTEARLSSAAARGSGQALASRSLVTGPGGKGGYGYGNAAVSRNAGSGGIGHGVPGGRGSGGEGNAARLGRGGVGVGQVRSSIAAAGAGKDSGPVSSSAHPTRTDEEIQILFDRYKAALYRIYNTHLRKDPTLRGKMVLKIAIEPSGVVSACTVDSCNMNAPEFSAQIVDRVKKFNFGPKEGVPKVTILYPIDFLPAR